MKFRIVVLALWPVCGWAAGDAPAEPKAPKEDPTAAAFARLGGSDLVGIYKGYEYLAAAGKADPAVVARLAAMMWDKRYSATSRLWALRTLAEIGPNAKAVMPDLVRAMEDPDPYFRLRGALAVLRAGGAPEKPLEALTALARGKDRSLRTDGINVIGEAGPLAGAALPLLTEVLGRADDPDRKAALRAVGAMGPAAREAVPLVVKLTEDKDQGVRETAVAALSGLGSDAPEAVRALLAMAGRPGYEGFAAAEALARVGKSAVPGLIELLRGDSRDGRANAAHALRFIGPAAAPAALALAKAVPAATGDLERANAVHALAAIRGPAVPHLAQLLRDPAVRARYDLAKALGEIGPDAGPAVPALVEAMKDRKAGDLDRRAAAEALGRVGAAAAVPDLVAVIPDRDLGVTYEAIRALGEIGPAAKDAVKPLVEAIRADHRFGRYGTTAGAAAWALGRIGKPAEPAIPLLIELLASDADREAAEALGRIGPAGKAALPRLRELYARGQDGPRIAAALAVSRIDPAVKDGAEALTTWLVATGESQGYERAALAAALGAVGPRAAAALPALRGLLDHQTEVSAAAAAAIYRINPGDPAALESLVRTLASLDTFGPAAACKALAAIGPAAKAALPDLRRLARDHRGYHERDMARRAIRAIDPAQEP